LFEDHVADYFANRGWSIKRAKGNVPGWDLIITKNRTSVYVEVKHDIASDRTGNYALELDSLEHTQSDYLIIGTPTEAYILSVTAARKLFNQYPKRQTGDFAWNYSAIVPKTIFQTKYQHL